MRRRQKCQFSLRTLQSIMQCVLFLFLLEWKIGTGSAAVGDEFWEKYDITGRSRF